MEFESKIWDGRFPIDENYGEAKYKTVFQIIKLKKQNIIIFL